MLRQWKPRPPVLIVANLPLAVVEGRIVCPRARGWAEPRLFPLLHRLLCLSKTGLAG